MLSRCACRQYDYQFCWPMGEKLVFVESQNLTISFHIIGLMQNTKRSLFTYNLSENIAKIDLLWSGQNLFQELLAELSVQTKVVDNTNGSKHWFLVVWTHRPGEKKTEEMYRCIALKKPEMNSLWPVEHFCKKSISRQCQEATCRDQENSMSWKSMEKSGLLGICLEKHVPRPTFLAFARQSAECNKLVI